MTIDLAHADMLEWLAAYDGPLFDSCVTDPPYHLTSIVRRFGGKRAAAAKDRDGLYQRASRGFMGKTWDGGDIAQRVETWRAVYDALKPGAHLVAFAGTRTYHRMVVAIEDAGFEIRDSILDLFDADALAAEFMATLTGEQAEIFARLIDAGQFTGLLAWIYGSGFPKSHDVSKGIAKRRTEDQAPTRIVCEFIRGAMDDGGLKSKDLAHLFDDCHPRLIDHWAARATDSQPALCTMGQWDILVDALKLAERDDFEFVAKEVARLNMRKGQRGERWVDAEVIGESTVASPGFGDHRFTGDRTIRALDDEAAAWGGWGTALKPALEPIVLARKPLSESSIAANVLKHGTGALNIDGCRIDGAPTLRTNRAEMGYHGGNLASEYRTGSDSGRRPANVVTDGSAEVAAMFPEAPGQLAPVRPDSGGGGKTANVFNNFAENNHADPRGDAGSAARFFYSAKAGPLDRIGSGHATVKPVDLMRWLVRLVTPTGGRVLEPFAGSGTTGIACMTEGFGCQMIELEADHVSDIERKLAFLRGDGGHSAIELHKAKHDRAAEKEAEPLGGLFGDAA